MSRIFLFSLLVSTLLWGFGITSDYEAARRQARQEHKVLLVMLARRSDNIKKPLKQIMQDKRTSELIKKHALFVLLYQDTKQSYPIEMLYTTATPTLFFLDEDELFICKALRGEIDPQKIRSCLENTQK